MPRDFLAQTWIGRHSVTVMRSALFGVSSTALSGLTNLGVQVVAAVLLAPTEFADFSIACVTALLVLGAGRAVLSQVDMLRGPVVGNAGPAEANIALSGVLVLLGSLSVAIAQLASAPATLMAVALGVAAAGVLIYQDSLRFRAFRAGRAAVAFVSDVVVLITVVLLFVVPVTRPSDSLTAVLVWVFGTLLGGVVAAVALSALSMRVRVGTTWLASHKDLVVPGMGEYLLQSGVPYALNFLVLAVGGPELFAGYRLAQLLFAGLGNFATGLNAAMLPRIVNDRQPIAARRQSRLEIIVVTVAAGLLAAVMVGLPGEWGSEVFGENWRLMGPFIMVCAIHGWVNALAVPNYALNRLLGHAKFSFWVRVVSSALTLILAFGAAAAAGVVEVAWAIAFPAVLAYGVRLWRAQRTISALIEAGETIP